jgi:O-antigen ligase
VIGPVFRIGPARERPPVRFTWIHYLLLCAVAYALMSAIVAGTVGRRYAILDLLDQFGFLPFFMFLLAPVIFATQRQRKILLGSIVGLAAYLSLTALFEKLHLNALVVPHYITDPSVGEHFGRARGPFVDAGADGLALYACAVAAVVGAVTWRRPRWKLVSIAVAALALLGVLLSQTRGAWLAAVVASVVTLGTTPRLRALLLPVAIAAAVIVVGAFAVIPGLSQQTQQRQSDQSPVYERQNTTAAGLRMVAARPLLGFGWDYGGPQLAPYFKLDPYIPLSGLGAGFHNQYLQYAVTLGLVGLGIWLLAVGGAFASAFSAPVAPDVARWQVALKALLLSWVIIGLSAPAYYIFTTLLLWTWCGIVYGAGWTLQPVGGRATTWRWSHGKPWRTAFG